MSVGEVSHQVMLTYTVLFLFSAKTLSFVNYCDFMLFLLVLEFMHVFTGIFGLDNSDDCVEPTRERQRICTTSVPSGCSLCRVGEVGISRARFVKFISARFPVLQTITRTKLYVVSC